VAVGGAGFDRLSAVGAGPKAPAGRTGRRSRPLGPYTENPHAGACRGEQASPLPAGVRSTTTGIR